MHNVFIEIKYPAVRQFTEDIGRLASKKHTIRAFLEVDVTDALQQISHYVHLTGRFLSWPGLLRSWQTPLHAIPPSTVLKKVKTT